MEFYYITSFDDLQKGAYGILEPIKSKCEKLIDLNEGLCIIPALTFDEQGYRLGFGKGYYDRFLAGFPGKSVVICYSDFVMKVPAEPHDMMADEIITE